MHISCFRTEYVDDCFNKLIEIALGGNIQAVKTVDKLENSLSSQFHTTATSKKTIHNVKKMNKVITPET